MASRRDPPTSACTAGSSLRQLVHERLSLCINLWRESTAGRRAASRYFLLCRSVSVVGAHRTLRRCGEPTRRYPRAAAPHAGSRSRVRVRATPRRRLAQPGARIPRGMWRPAHASRPAAVPVRLCVRGPSSQSPYLAQTTTRTRCVLLAPTSVAQLFPAETVKRFSDVACAALRNHIRKNAQVKRSCDLTRI